MDERDPREITEPGFYWVKGRPGHAMSDWMPVDWEPARRREYGSWLFLESDMAVHAGTFGETWHETFVVGDRITPPSP